jgi:pantoate--beta-alanine ligase
MKPAVAATTDAVRQAVAAARRRGQTVGLVPTMGALHEGHASLIRAARAETDFVVVSIFVNPTQFGPNEDLARYPRPLEQDLELCGREGADLAFVPEVAAIYPPGFRTYVEVHGLQDVLEGASRPGHFRGVCTVVLKLIHIVRPDVAYFGQKDAQQARIIRQMVRDLDVPLRLRICPTVREADGLALSSRNRYLSPEERGRALALAQALFDARQRVERGERDAAAVQRAARQRIEAVPGVVVDYVAVVDADSFEPVERIRGNVLIAAAVRIGSTRLIDNVLLENVR